MQTHTPLLQTHTTPERRRMIFGELARKGRRTLGSAMSVGDSDKVAGSAGVVWDGVLSGEDGAEGLE